MLTNLRRNRCGETTRNRFVRTHAVVLIGALAVAFHLLAATAAVAGEVVYADGRREVVAAPRKTSRGLWTAEKDGRRIALTPGDVVVVIDDEGAEVVTIPALSDAPLDPAAAMALAQIKDVKNKSWMQAATTVGRSRARTAMDALVEMLGDRNKEVRKRAVAALALLRTRESVVAAVRAAATEKDRKTQREMASQLLSVREIVIRCDAAEGLRTGLQAQDASVRITFALLAPGDDPEALRILRVDGVGHSDHHFRESAAIALARRGDAGGEAILIKMLRRSRLPGFDAGDRQIMERYLAREQVEICGLLRALASAEGKVAVVAAKKSRLPTVAAAAATALESWTESSD